MDFVRVPREGRQAGRRITVGSLVIVYSGHTDLSHLYIEAGAIWQNRYGAFHHDDIIGKEFGAVWKARVRSGWVHVLSPTPELWALCLSHRTQIIYELDSAMICFQLGLRPGLTVIESGTGSGAMSTALMRAVAPTGFLHTFEFNESRATKAAAEFARNGLADLVRVTHKDVCGKGHDAEGGFGEELRGQADAVLLDLPEPWLAVKFAEDALKPDGRLASYSPCIEQVAKTCEVLRAYGFHSIETIETRLKPSDVTEVRLGVPFFGREADERATEPSSSSEPPRKRPRPPSADAPPINAADPDPDADAAGSERGMDVDEAESSAAPRASCRRPTPPIASESSKAQVNALVARPVPEMRGHTAFLTFCTRSSLGCLAEPVGDSLPDRGPTTEAEGGYAADEPPPSHGDAPDSRL